PLGNRKKREKKKRKATSLSVEIEQENRENGLSQPEKEEKGFLSSDITPTWNTSIDKEEEIGENKPNKGTKEMTKDCLESTELTENEEKGDALRNTQFDSQRTSDFFIPN
ncbi:hypothetical protein ACJMK2_022646, partial [Sinanodonta woodiana]